MSQYVSVTNHHRVTNIERTIFKKYLEHLDIIPI